MPRLVDTSVEEPPKAATNHKPFPAAIAKQLASAPSTSLDTPLWQGPSASGKLGGITQSALQDYLGCKERFRVKYLLGLKAPDRWERSTGYGNMWHACEEMLAKSSAGQYTFSMLNLDEYVTKEMKRYPLQRPEIQKWSDICRMQFPEYAKHWQGHPDVLDRQPLMQESVFDVPYDLPSGRRIRLRGKIDSTNLIPSLGGVYVQENKSTGDVDEVAIRRRLTFDLQSLLYLVVIDTLPEHELSNYRLLGYKLCGIRYNVVRRPLSGGEGSIRPHKAKTPKKGKHVAAETEVEFLERLRRDYIAAEPDKWFFRVTCKVSEEAVLTFRKQCLDPLLENLADDHQWWEWCLRKGESQWNGEQRSMMFPAHCPRHVRYPFGVHCSLADGGYSELDDYLATGQLSGLKRAVTLFDELEEPCQQ